MVLTLVLLPALAKLAGATPVADAHAGPETSLWIAMAFTIVKIAGFLVLAVVAGPRVVPWILRQAARTGSHELFTLAVLAVSIGIAYGAAALFGVSFALGAFCAGVILSNSELSQRAADDALPLQHAFAVIFFVSVGMLFDPGILVRDPLAVLGVLAVILFGKSLAALVIVQILGYPIGTALTVSASLAQIGEFSFILAGLGVDLGILPERGRNLILAGAILSILINPLLFAGLDLLQARREKAKAEAKPVEPEEEGAAREPVRPAALTNHVVLVGHGRVGGVISERLADKKVPLLVIEDDEERIAELKAQGVEAIAGNAADPEIIAAANLAAASCLLVAIPDAFEGGQVVEQARALNAKLRIIARAHSEAEVLHLKKRGASVVILGEHEIARAMVELVAPGG